MSNALSIPAAAASGPASPAEPGQYLTFVLGGELYAIGILSIKEIIEYAQLTEVPMMPACVRGVINLRGAVVPVVDLQARFGKAATGIGKRSCIVIIELPPESDAVTQTVGVMVDAVNEVIDVLAADIEPPPAFGARLRRDFIQGVGKVKGRFVILLDVAQVLSLEQIGAVLRLEHEAVTA